MLRKKFQSFQVGKLSGFDLSEEKRQIGMDFWSEFN